MSNIAWVQSPGHIGAIDKVRVLVVFIFVVSLNISIRTIPPILAKFGPDSPARDTVEVHIPLHVFTIDIKNVL